MNNLKVKLRKTFLWRYQKNNIPTPGITSTQEMQDLHNKGYKTLLKETKELNKCIHIPYSWFRRQCCYNGNTY